MFLPVGAPGGGVVHWHRDTERATEGPGFQVGRSVARRITQLPVGDGGGACTEADTCTYALIRTHMFSCTPWHTARPISIGAAAT
eukprot:3154046-Rhodomonas_salina.1